jgi:hypothetical protein
MKKHENQKSGGEENHLGWPTSPQGGLCGLTIRAALACSHSSYPRTMIPES